MSELLRIGNVEQKDGESLSEMMRRSIVSSTSLEIREMAKFAVQFFDDKPSAEIDIPLLTIKLCAEFRRVGATPEEVLGACMRLNTTQRFRPGCEDYVQAIEYVRYQAEKSAFQEQLSRSRTFVDQHGNEFLCTPEYAETMGFTEQKPEPYEFERVDAIACHAWARGDVAFVFLIERQHEANGVHPDYVQESILSIGQTDELPETMVDEKVSDKKPDHGHKSTDCEHVDRST